MAYILSSQEVRIDQPLASLGSRLGAFAIDYFMLSLVYYFILSIIDDFSLNRFIVFLLLTAPLFYPIISETFFNGQTLGKWLLKIKVMSIDGGAPKQMSLILRWLMLPIDMFGSLGIGILCIFFTERQQRLGDLVAGTWVVRTKTYNKTSFSLAPYEIKENYKPQYPGARNLTAQQALIIEDTITYHNYSSSDHIHDLAEKVQTIVKERYNKNDMGYLIEVLHDYRRIV